MFTVVTEFFRVADELRMIFFSSLLIISMIVAPRGLVVPMIGLMVGIGRKLR